MTNLQLINQARSKFTEKMGALKHWGFTNAKLAKKVGACEKTIARAVNDPFNGASGSTVLFLQEFYEEEKKRRGIFDKYSAEEALTKVRG